MAEEKTLTTPKPVNEATKDVKVVGPVGTAKTPREALEQERQRNPVPFVAASVPSDFDEPFKVAEPHTDTPAEAEVKKQKAEVSKKIGEILKAYHDRESEIPSSNEYWQLVAKLRSLNNP